MQTFFTQTLESLFIQKLVSNTPLPIFDTVRYGEFIVKGKYYVYNHEIIKCTKTGYILDDVDDPPLYPSQTLYPNDELYPSDGNRVALYENILRYEFGKYYPKITYMYQPKTSYYDSDTHYHLGKYLRTIRDTYNVDYMPFYNCYNAKNIPNILISGDQVKAQNNTKNLIAVPILYNKPYTFAIHSNRSVDVKPIKYSHKLISSTIYTIGFYDTDRVETNQTLNLGTPNKNTLYSYGVYTKDIDELSNQKNLYLCFQSESISSIAIVEGNYTQAETKAMNYYDSSKYVPNLTSKLSLFDNMDNFYAFSDRLIEGLLHNIINRQDEIYWNFGMVQDALGIKNNKIWDDRYTVTLFNKYLSDKNPDLYKYDITGNVDKDIEFWLMKGAN